MKKIFSRRASASSKAAYLNALKYIPGGVNSPVRAFRSVGGNPLFVEKASGATLTDIDGNTYTDYCLSWGVHILGHNSAPVNRAVSSALRNGSSYGAPTLLETELARRISSAVPSIQKIRFVNSGTEAVMSAVRLARAFTKREIIVKFDGCYHGHADHLLVSAGSGVNELKRSSSDGVPPRFTELTVSIPFNNRRAVEKAFARHKGRIAAVLVEPVPANMGVVLPEEGYLSFLRKSADINDSLLIFDEVITGFRLRLGGAQEFYGVMPDITCLGKIIGGGLPAGAFGGRAEIMDLLAPSGPVYQAGTLSGNPLAMAAGIAVLKRLSEKGFYEKLNARAADFISGLKKISAANGITLAAAGSIFSVFFSKNEVRDYDGLKKCDTKRFAAFHNAMLDEGIYMSPAQGEADFLSIKHTPAVLARTLSILQRGLRD